jgi:hypothetical protein
VFLTSKAVVTRVARGTERRIAFRLSARGARLLRHVGSFTAILRGSLRSGRNAAIVHKARLRLKIAPSR